MKKQNLIILGVVALGVLYLVTRKKKKTDATSTPSTSPSSVPTTGKIPTAQEYSKKYMEYVQYYYSLLKKSVPRYDLARIESIYNSLNDKQKEYAYDLAVRLLEDAKASMKLKGDKSPYDPAVMKAVDEIQTAQTNFFINKYGKDFVEKNRNLYIIP